MLHDHTLVNVTLIPALSARLGTYWLPVCLCLPVCWHLHHCGSFLSSHLVLQETNVWLYALLDGRLSSLCMCVCVCVCMSVCVMTKRSGTLIFMPQERWVKESPQHPVCPARLVASVWVKWCRKLFSDPECGGNRSSARRAAGRTSSSHRHHLLTRSIQYFRWNNNIQRHSHKVDMLKNLSI